MAEAGGSDFFDSTFLRKLENLSILSRKVFAGRLRGEQRSKRYGSSVEFADFRPYSQGDDFRRIDWNAYARFGNLFLKLFVEEEDLFVYLLVDSSASMGFGEPTTKFALARRIAAALAYVALSNLDRVALASMAQHPAEEDASRVPNAETPGESERSDSPSRSEADHMGFVRGKGSIFGIFDFLRHLEPSGQTDLSHSIRDFLLRHRHKGVAIVISDFLSPGGYEDGLKALASAGFQPMTIQVLAREEFEPDVSGDYRLIDSETGRPVDISTTRRMIETYRRRARRFVTEFDHFCKARNIPTLRTSSDVDFEQLMLGTLRRAAVVR